MIIIDTRVWIPLLNGVEHAKAGQAQTAIEGPEDLGMPGIMVGIPGATCRAPTVRCCSAS